MLDSHVTRHAHVTTELWTTPETGVLRVAAREEERFASSRAEPDEGLRHLQGCYIDIDGPRSLYRVVRRRLAAGTPP